LYHEDFIRESKTLKIRVPLVVHLRPGKEGEDFFNEGGGVENNKNGPERKRGHKKKETE